MKTIRRQRWFSICFLGIAGLSLIAFMALEQYVLAAISVGCIVGGFIAAIVNIRKVKSARLITENQIIDICTAIITDSEVGRDSSSQTIECVLSPFGLLMGSKVYKFGRDGIQLYTIDIDKTQVIVEFGSVRKRLSAKLLHDQLNEDELALLVKKIEYETGISP